MLRVVISLCLMSAFGCAASRHNVLHESVAFESSTLPVVARGDSDELSDLKKAAHRDSDSESPAKAKKTHANSAGQSEPCEESSSENLLGALIKPVVTAPFTLPILLTGDDHDHVTEFPDFPYSDDAVGSLLKDSFAEGKKQSWMATVQTFAIPQAHDVDRYGTRLLLDSSWRVGLDTETNLWTQRLASGEHDQLWTGDANLVIRFAESERVQWRAGVGANWLSDSVKNEAGINFTYGVDWFPVRPWTVSSVIDFGSLGHGGMFHHRTTVGAMIGAAELFAGYDFFQLGASQFQGPVAGVGWHF